MIAYKSDERIFHSQPILYVLLFGLVAAKITNRLVVSISIHLNEYLFNGLFQVAHMCKGEISHKDATMLAPLALFLNQYFNTFISEGPLLYLALVWVTLDLVWYCSKVWTVLITPENITLSNFLGLLGNLCVPWRSSFLHTPCHCPPGEDKYESIQLWQLLCHRLDQVPLRAPQTTMGQVEAHSQEDRGRSTVAHK